MDVLTNPIFIGVLFVTLGYYLGFTGGYRHGHSNALITYAKYIRQEFKKYPTKWKIIIDKLSEGK